MKKMKDYHDFYLKCGVLLLADVFEQFRNNSLKNYGLFPSHYLSTQGLNWNTMLKMMNLDLFQILKCICSLRKMQEVEFLIFLIDF